MSLEVCSTIIYNALASLEFCAYKKDMQYNPIDIFCDLY